MKTFSLDDLLKSISGAVLSANAQLKEAQRDMSDAFQPAGPGGAQEPRTLKLMLPRDVGNEGEPAEAVHEVPTSTLSHHHGLSLDALSFEVPCLIEGLETAHDGTSKLAIALGSEIAQSVGLCTLNVSFRGTDPPEGRARINDRLLKKF